MMKTCAMAAAALVGLSLPAHAVSLLGGGAIVGEPGSIFYDGIDAQDLDRSLAGTFGVILTGRDGAEPVFDLEITRMIYDGDRFDGGSLLSQPVIARASGSLYSFENNTPLEGIGSFDELDRASILFEVGFDLEDVFPDYLTGTLYIYDDIESLFGPYPDNFGDLTLESAAIPPIPVPASLPMTIAGIAALAFLRRKTLRA